MEYIIVLCTINDFNQAKEISKIIIEEKLAACVNIIPKISSIYFWNDEIVEDDEYLMIIKTRRNLFKELKLKITQLHPYDVPEIISLNIEDGSKLYLDWIKNSTKETDI